MPTERELPFSNPHVDYRAAQRNKKSPNVRSNSTPIIERLFATDQPETLFQALMEQGPSDALNEVYLKRPIIEAVARCVDRLSPAERDVIEATFYERASLSEIGRRLGYSKTHVWRLRNSALGSLAQLLTTDPTIRNTVMPPTSWKEAATHWVSAFSNGQSEPNEIDINSPIRLRDMVVRHYDKTGNVGPMSAFVGIAYDAIGELRAHGLWSDGHAMIDLLVRKQRDYGHGNINAFGLYGVLVRLSDKIERLKNLMSNGIDPANESTVDTLHDMVGYCVIAHMLADGTFDLPLGPHDD